MTETEIFTLVVNIVWSAMLFGLSTGLFMAFLSRRG